MAIYKSLVKKISVSSDKKTKQKEYLPNGALPIVDQGQKMIGGYTDDTDKQVVCDLPVIVFGDHTKTVKYIDFPFGAGADGIKVLQPKEGILPKYLYYTTQYLVLKLEDKGYARHYQYIEKKELSIPLISEQERIITRIEALFSQLDKGVETLQKTKQQLAVYRQAVLKEAFNSIVDCEKGTIQSVCIGSFNDLFDGAIHQYGTKEEQRKAAEDEWNRTYGLFDSIGFKSSLDQEQYGCFAAQES